MPLSQIIVNQTILHCVLTSIEYVTLKNVSIFRQSAVLVEEASSGWWLQFYSAYVLVAHWYLPRCC